MDKLPEFMKAMTTMKKSVCFIGCALCALFVGCTPDKVSITIPSSAVEKAKAGNLAYVKVRAVFSSTGKDTDGNMPKVKRIALRHLGEGAEIEIEDEDYSSKLTASFKIPFGKGAVLAEAPKSILVLSMDDDGKIELKNGPGLSALNHELDDIDSSIDARFNGGVTLFRFTGNSDSALRLQVIGAFADDKAIAIGDVRVDEDEEVVVKFNRNDGSIWNSLDPFVILR